MGKEVFFSHSLFPISQVNWVEHKDGVGNSSITLKLTVLPSQSQGQTLFSKTVFKGYWGQDLWAGCHGPGYGRLLSIMEERILIHRVIEGQEKHPRTGGHVNSSAIIRGRTEPGRSSWTIAVIPHWVISGVSSCLLDVPRDSWMNSLMNESTNGELSSTGCLSVCCRKFHHKHVLRPLIPCDHWTWKKRWVNLEL